MKLIFSEKKKQINYNPIDFHKIILFYTFVLHTFGRNHKQKQTDRKQLSSQLYLSCICGTSFNIHSLIQVYGEIIIYKSRLKCAFRKRST